MIRRVAQDELEVRLAHSPAATLLGPRQVGKTTLARAVADAWPGGATYLDLERPADLRRLEDPDAFLRAQAPRLTVIDEVQRMPELFPILRGVIDHNRRHGFGNGQFLLLGSASLDLVKGVDESLAGRVSHLELAGVDTDEAQAAGIGPDQLWLRGGFPDSLAAESEAVSLRWRDDLVRSYLERDVPMFAPRVPATTLRHLWTMLAHTSGGLFNASRLGKSLGVKGQTVDRYVDLLADLGLVRRLEPWFSNTGKRLVKAPKIYVRDTGLIHSLLEIPTLDALAGHPSVGASFESFCVEAIINAIPHGVHPYFYRTARGAEIDLVLVRADQPVAAIEVKRSAAARPSPGFYTACDDLGIDHRYLVHGSDEAPYESKGVTVLPLPALIRRLRAAAATTDPADSCDAMTNPALDAMRMLQHDMTGQAEQAGFRGDDDVSAYISQMRRAKQAS